MLFCCVHRAPDVHLQEFISAIGNCMSTTDMEKSDLVVLGDFNVNLLPNSKDVQQ